MHMFVCRSFSIYPLPAASWHLYCDAQLPSHNPLPPPTQLSSADTLRPLRAASFSLVQPASVWFRGSLWTHGKVSATSRWKMMCFERSVIEGDIIDLRICLRLCSAMLEQQVNFDARRVGGWFLHLKRGILFVCCWVFLNLATAAPVVHIKINTLKI